MIECIYSIFSLPLIAFLVLLLTGKKLPRQGDWLALLCTGIAALLSIYCLATVDHPINIPLSEFTIGKTLIQFGFCIDSITLLMLVLITLIGFWVQVFSIAYMKDDAQYTKYWMYLSLFLFAMIGLVLSDNLLLLYIFWELVGFTSYLLIGFWYHKQAAALAAKKAFIVNRIGDIGFLIGIFIIYNQCHTFHIASILQQFNPAAPWAQAAGLCLAIGAIAKSAQFPLFVWLPDAMEGPTPVSSLIHAATMVAAGIYLLARMFPVLDALTLDTLLIIGTFTAFMAATIALVQFDIKKVLAYSTVSQLGLMLAGIGAGVVNASLFHLATHAFFKCLLFLVAGLIMHQLKQHFKQHKITADYQDMRLMGGFRKLYPFVFYTYLVAAAALVGLPFFTGFLSKDALLEGAVQVAHVKGAWWILIPVFQFITVLLTAIYIARQGLLVFFGDARFDKAETIKQPSNTMRIPIAFLAACCLFFVVGLNPFAAEQSWLLHFLGNTSSESSVFVPFLSVSLVLLGIGIVYFYLYRRQQTTLITQPQLYSFLANAWYIDAAYQRVLVNPVIRLSELILNFDKKVIDGFVNLLPKMILQLTRLFNFIDRKGVDGAVNGSVYAVGNLGNRLRNLQSGQVQTYLLSGIIGLGLLLAWLAF